MNFSEKMANQIQHKYDDFGKFVSICKKFVNLIQNYEGNDPLAPWYDYLLWFEENFVIDFKQESIFDQILAACLCRFENEERYKQDRRLIKLFIKFVSKFCKHKNNEIFRLRAKQLLFVSRYITKSSRICTMM